MPHCWNTFPAAFNANASSSATASNESARWTAVGFLYVFACLYGMLRARTMLSVPRLALETSPNSLLLSSGDLFRPRYCGSITKGCVSVQIVAIGNTPRITPLYDDITFSASIIVIRTAVLLNLIPENNSRHQIPCKRCTIYCALNIVSNNIFLLNDHILRFLGTGNRQRFVYDSLFALLSFACFGMQSPDR